MNLLALVPWPYRILAIAGLIAACIGFGYVKGFEHEEAKYNALADSVQAAGEAQNANTAVIIAQQKQISQEAGNEATTLRKRLAQYLAANRLPRDNPGSSRLPPVPDAAPGIDAAPTELTTCPTNDPTILDNAAQDALSLLLLQKWVSLQKARSQSTQVPPRTAEKKP